MWPWQLLLGAECKPYHSYLLLDERWVRWYAEHTVDHDVHTQSTLTSYSIAKYIVYKRHWDGQDSIEGVGTMFVPINAVTLIVIEK